MTDPQYCLLPDRAVLSVSGPDAREFLQGMISNDMNKVSPNHAIWAAFLTPQGKYLYDFFVVQSADAQDETFYLDCEAERSSEFKRKLSMYKLRSKVTVREETDTQLVAVAWNGAVDTEPGQAKPVSGGTAYTDPRLAEAGTRFILPTSAVQAEPVGLGRPSTPVKYDAHRIALGLPDGSRDLAVEKSILLENGFEDLNGVDWDKGCYIGQELTARTKYRALIKKRLVPVSIEGTPPIPGTALIDGKKEVGEMRSVQGNHGLALIKIEAIEAGTPLSVGAATVTPRKPSWATF